MFNLKWKDLLNSFFLVSIGFIILVLVNSISYFAGANSSINIFKQIFVLDSYWYQSIIDHGYMKHAIGDPLNDVFVEGGIDGMSNWAFFPLFPLVIKILLTITFNLISIEIIAFVFTFVCYVFMIYNVVQYLRDKNIMVNYFHLFLLFVLSSVMMLFFSLYTETLTMLLIILLIRACDKKKFLLGGIICALLSSIKVQGCFWCIYLFIKIYQESLAKGKNVFYTFFLTIKEIIKNPIYFLSLCISPLGLFIFFVTLKAFDLSILSFVHAQSGWGKESGFFITTIIESLFGTKIFEAFAAILFLVFALYLLFTKKYLSFTMLALYILSSTTSSVNSVNRYVLGSVIFSLEFYLLLDKIKEKRKTKETKILSNIALGSFYSCKIAFVIFTLFSFFAFDTSWFY